MKAKLPIALAASLLIAGSAYADGNITGLVFNKNTSEIPNMCNKHKIVITDSSLYHIIKRDNLKYQLL